MLAQYNKAHHTSISLEEDEQGEFSPVIDLEEQTIILNPCMETMIMLFNLSMENMADGCSAINHFLLYHLAMDKNLYGVAESQLRLLQADLDRLMAGRQEHFKNFNGICIQYQLAFLMMHEASHIYFHLHSDELTASREAMREHLVWLRKELDTKPPLMLRLLQWIFPGLRHNMAHSFDEAKADPILLEELLCDDRSWQITSSILSQSVPDKELQAMLAAFTVYALYYVEMQRTLTYMFITGDKRLRMQNLMFDTSRWTVMSNKAWDFVDPAHVSTYKSMLNTISRQYHFFLIRSSLGNIDAISPIRESEKGNYSPRETLRLKKMYDGLAEVIEHIFCGSIPTASDL